MTQNTVSPAQYRAAHHAVERISPVLTALENINPQAFQYDAEAAEKVAEFTQFLNGIYDQNKAIIDQGDEQYENRPVELIGAAASRILNEIPHLIELEQKSLQARKEGRELKADELVKKGFSHSEIDRVIPPISSDEIALSHARVAELKTESAAIEKFLGDSPRHDLDLLKGTQLYPVPLTGGLK